MGNAQGNTTDENMPHDGDENGQKRSSIEVKQGNTTTTTTTTTTKKVNNNRAVKTISGMHIKLLKLRNKTSNSGINNSKNGSISSCKKEEASDAAGTAEIFLTCAEVQSIKVMKNKTENPEFLC
jgi:hypothetical protein